mmetsp:Transcript_98410/g.195144  ORF Transcript_98410/g.195144 Transcript_98410/m.195144 type:complete len:208 (+) Transcript_98410:417-1040(+)
MLVLIVRKSYPIAVSPTERTLPRCERTQRRSSFWPKSASLATSTSQCAESVCARLRPDAWVVGGSSMLTSNTMNSVSREAGHNTANGLFQYSAADNCTVRDEAGSTRLMTDAAFVQSIVEGSPPSACAVFGGKKTRSSLQTEQTSTMVVRLKRWELLHALELISFFDSWTLTTAHFLMKLMNSCASFSLVKKKSSPSLAGCTFITCL